MLLQYVLFSFCVYVYGVSLCDKIIAEINMNYFSRYESEKYPSCVDIVDVWPPPYSVLSAIKSEKSYSDFIFHVTFSRPVFIPPTKRQLPISLSVSTTNLLQFHPNYGRYSYGSERTVFFYFRVPISLQYSPKVNLIMDGGSIEAKSIPWIPVGRTNGTSWSLKLPTTVIGEYYFPQFLQSHIPFEYIQPKVFLPSPYCGIKLNKRMYVSQSLDANLFSEYSTSNNSVLLHSDEHLLNIKNSSSFSLRSISAESVKLYISIPLQKGNETRNYDVNLPSIIKAKFSGNNLSVKLPHQRINIIASGMSYDIYNIPVNKELIYDLRERIYHNQYKLSHLSEIISFYEGTYQRKFPVFSMEDGIIRVTDPYTGNELDVLYKIDEGWTHVTRGASINSTADEDAFGSRSTDDFHICPSNMKRNYGRQGSYINSVIEIGSFYHRLVPQSEVKWFKTRLQSRTFLRKAEVGVEGFRSIVGGEILGITPIFDEDFPISVKRAISKYFCVIRALPDLSEPPDQNIYKSYYSLENCAFVPRQLANSQNCGGLQLFRNFPLITQDINFCRKGLGDCIGPPLAFFNKYPSQPVYDWLPFLGVYFCNDSACMNISTLSNISIDNDAVLNHRSHIVLSRDSNGLTNTTFQLMPRVTREHYYLTIPDISVLKPILPEKCDDINITVDLPLGSSSRIVLSAIITNKGEGGGDLAIDLKCSNLIKINPSLSPIKDWIKPENEVLIEIILETELALPFKEISHKCQLTINISHPFDNWRLNCPLYFSTFYGSIRNPCEIQAELPLVNIIYYVMPESELRKIDSLSLFNKSSAGMQLVFIRGITLSLEVPSFEVELLRTIYQIQVDCAGIYTMILTEDSLLSDASLSRVNSSYGTRSREGTLSYRTDLTLNRKIFFFYSKDQFEKMGAIGLCSVQVVANRPNGICIKSRDIISQQYIPLGSMSLNALVIQQEGLLLLFSQVYGMQELIVIFVLGFCCIFIVIFSCIICVGMGYKLIARKRLPTIGNLHRIFKDHKRYKKKDRQYWGNPQVYITTDESESHFILYNYKTNNLQPFDNTVKGMSIMGSLQFKTKEMSVVFGHVKKIFMKKDKLDSDIWLLASSGMYLLKHQNVAPEYEQVHEEFIERCNHQIMYS